MINVALRKIYLLIALLPVFAFAQSEKNPCETLSKINALIQEEHYKPKTIDDSLSVYVFKSFLETIDDENSIFIESEISVLKKNEFKIDDYINSKNCAFLDEIYNSYTIAVDRYEKIIASIKSEPFPYSSSEVIRLSKKSFSIVKDEKELKNLCKKKLLFDVLKDVAGKSKNKDSLVANFDKIAAISKAKIFETYACKTSSNRLSRTEFNSKFFSVFCSYFDPHTEYFSESEKSSFLSMVSADNMTFGLNFSLNEKEELTVDEIIPGSSAYFTEKVDAGDLVLKIKSKNEEFDIACSSINKVAEIISSNDYKTANFTLKKKSGEIYTIDLVKKVMKDYQNNVYSFIIEKDGKKTGYIRIPSFYATFEDGKTNVSDDVAKEVYKLQKDNVDGLIIDLENNGGGSMEEAMRLTGLFIDIGPIAIMDDNKGNKQTLKDVNRGTIYNGTMVVLINGFSASASEFFSNAMQDYNRAVIVGNQSLGKASMQRILPIDESPNPKEFIKLTIEKFYRITGKSNQTIGITPDVQIPSLFDKQMPRENSYPTALKNDVISSNLRYNLVINDNATAIQKSEKRVSENVSVMAITKLNEKINELFDKDLPPITLQFNNVFDEANRINSLWKEIEKINETEYNVNVERNSVDIEYQQFDEYLKASNKEKIEAIKSNIHIVEALNIINDLKK